MNCFKFKLNRKSSIVKRNSTESNSNDSIIQSLQNELIEEDRFSSQNNDFIEIEKKQEEISKVEARFTALLNDSDNKAPNNAQIPSN